MKVRLKAARILDFDIEARPLSWYGGDYVTREVTAIAWSWVGEDAVHWDALHRDDESGQHLLENFLVAYNEADIVTGHYIRGYDLPNINGALSEYGLPPLEDKLTSDTKLDLIKRSGMSNSQENLAAMLGVRAPKVQMDQTKWREANRLTDKGIALTIERVCGDVVQHKEMRARLLRFGWLKAPQVWSGTPSKSAKYSP